jgi:hypothetical protein
LYRYTKEADPLWAAMEEAVANGVGGVGALEDPSHLLGTSMKPANMEQFDNDFLPRARFEEIEVRV